MNGFKYFQAAYSKNNNAKNLSGSLKMSLNRVAGKLPTLREIDFFNKKHKNNSRKMVQKRCFCFIF